MAIICPNFNIPGVQEQFNKLKDKVGEDLAYLLWHRQASGEAIFNKEAWEKYQESLVVEQEMSNKFLKRKKTAPKPSDEKNRLATEEEYQIFDKETEVKWFQENLNVPLEVVDGLINAAEFGVQAWGVFRNSGVEISNRAKVGTVYHEAFHVVFNMYLTPSQQEDLITEVSQGKKLTRLQAEELLADRFMKYKLSMGNERTSSTKINNFFANLLDLIKSFFNKHVSEDLIFSRINRGYYKNFNPKRNINSVTPQTRWKVGNLTNTETKDRGINVSDEIRKIIDEEFNKVTNKSRSEFVQEFLSAEVEEDGITVRGIDKLMKLVYNNLRDEYIRQDKEGLLTPYRNIQFTQTLSNIIKLDEDMEPMPGKVETLGLGKIGWLLFAKIEGITFKAGNKVYSGQDLVTDEETFEIAEDENTQLEGWQIENIKTSRRDGARSEIRKELSYVRELEEDGTSAIDKIGLPKYVPTAEAFATIIDEMQDIYDVDEMVTKMEELVTYKPEYGQILSKLSNKEFKTLFFNAFQNTHVPFMVADSAIDEDDKGNTTTKFRFFQSNKTGVIDMVVNEWKNNFSNSRKNKTINAEGEFVGNKELEVLYAKKPHTLNELYALYNGVGIAITKKELQMMEKEVIDPIKNITRLQEFWKDSRLLVKKILNGENIYETERRNVYKSAVYIKHLRKNLQESSHISIDNKPYYSHVLSFFASKQVKKLKDKAERLKYTSRTLYGKMPWLKRMDENPDFYNTEFQYGILEGKKWHDDNVGVKYEEMSGKDLEIVKINSFLVGDTETTTSGMAWYHMAPLADAGNSILIKGEKFNNDQVVDYLYEVALGEWERIQYVSTMQKKIQNFSDDVNNGSKFHFFPFNDSDNKKVRADIKTAFESNNVVAIKSLIIEMLDKEYKISINRLKSNGTIAEMEKSGNYISGRIKGGTRALNDTIKNYVYNSYFANTQMIVLFQGDPAFYKNSSDFFKRAKEVWSPGLLQDTKATFEIANEDLSLEEKFEGISTNIAVSGDSYNTTYLYDILTKSEELGNDIEAALLANSVDKVKARSIGRKFRDDSTNTTDAQAIISLRRYRAIQIGLGRWDDAKNKDYYKVRAGEKALSKFQPLKPFMFTHRMEEGVVVPTQNKNSEFILIPALAYLDANDNVVFPTKEDRENNYKNFKSPRLARILDYLQRDSYEDNNFKDSVQFAVSEFGGTSAVKAGASGVVTLDNIDNGEVHVLDNSDYRLQVETPDHFTESESIIGTQGRRNIVADILAEKFDDLNLTKDELITLYHDVVSADIEESYEQLLERFGVLNAINLIEDSNDKAILTPVLKGTQNASQQVLFEEWERVPENSKKYDKLKLDFHNAKIDFIQQLLLEEVWKRGLGEAYETSLQIETVNGKKRFKVPLFSPTLAKKSESLVGAIFKNKIVKQKMPGGALIQFSGFGYEEDLKIVIENNRLKEVQIKLPFWMLQDYPELMKDGKFDMEAFNKAGLDKLIGYRIPTEDKYSILPLRIVGFLPQESGAVIMLPKEITTLTGSDFDVDKFYIYLPSFKKKHDGTVEKVKYYTTPSREWYSQWVRNNVNKDVREYVNFLSVQEKERVIKEANSRFEAFKKSFNFKQDFKEAQAALKSGEIGTYVEALNETRKNILASLPDDIRDEFNTLKSILDEQEIRGINRVLVYLEATEKANLSEVSEEVSEFFNDLVSIHKEELRMYGLKKDSIDKFIADYKTSQANALTNVTVEQKELFVNLSDDIIDYMAELGSLINYETFKENAANNSSRYNSRAARDNMKLDIYWNVLTHQDTFEKIINPGNFDELKEIVKEINELAGYAPEKNKLVASPSVHIETFEDYMAGKQLISIFASQNAAHAVTQHSQLGIANAVGIDGRTFNSLHEIKDTKGNFISRNLAQLLAAVVDNAKDPVSKSLNISMFTADVVSQLLRLGIPTDTVMYIINQPVIRQLAEKFANTPGKNQDYRDVRDALFAEYAAKGGTPLDNASSITSAQLKKNIQDGKNADPTTQATIFKMFDAIKEISFDLGKITRVTRTDSVKRAINLNTNFLLESDYNDVLESKKLTGVTSVLDNFKLLKSFYDYTVKYPTTQLKEIFPWDNGIFRDIKSNILNNMSDNKNLTAEQLTYINFEILGYLATGFSMFNGKNVEKIIKESAEALETYKKNFPELKDNAFIKHLEIETISKKNTRVDAIRFRNTGSMNEDDIQDVFDGWKELLDEPKYRSLGEGLIKTVFYTNGFHFGPNTFSHFIPPSFYSIKLEGKESFADYLYNLQDELYGEMASQINFMSSKEPNSFYDQFYRNNWENTNYVPSIDNKRVKVVDGQITVVHKFFPDLITSGSPEGKSTVSDYITVDTKGVKTLFVKNYNLSGDKQSTYTKTTPLGIKGIHKELGMYVDKSIYKVNQAKADKAVTPATKATTPTKPSGVSDLASGVSESAMAKMSSMPKFDKNDVEKLPNCII